MLGLNQIGNVTCNSSVRLWCGRELDEIFAILRLTHWNLKKTWNFITKTLISSSPVRFCRDDCVQTTLGTAAARRPAAWRPATVAPRRWSARRRTWWDVCTPAAQLSLTSVRAGKWIIRLFLLAIFAYVAFFSAACSTGHGSPSFKYNWTGWWKGRPKGVDETHLSLKHDETW